MKKIIHFFKVIGICLLLIATFPIWMLFLLLFAWSTRDIDWGGYDDPY